ncbi:MAG: type VI secretion system baseplate subunit TssF [Acidiphilium sp.]|nr:type VI secretion system baseplate subunit TssF [Acidiphilium sp.]MDD4936595.1 type VI secretion system baseplate subunit TssF [Acidiphilium sp.]
MSDSLLPYFNRELLAIRKLAAEFAESHPKIAGRLRLSPDAVDDPHVARLLDGVAFLSARVHKRLDDEFPELTDALLGALYPGFLAPIPSCAVAQFECKPDLQANVRLDAGFAVETERVRGQACRFQTAYPVSLWPIRIEQVRLAGQPFVAPANPLAPGAASVLRIVLGTMVPEMSFAKLGLDRLRLYLRGGQAIAPHLYELLAAHTVGVALAESPGDPHPVLLPRESVIAVGFGEDEALLPWPARGFTGFRLLAEYFAFPEKFMFLDIDGLDRKTLAHAGNRLEIFIYLDRSAIELERAVSIAHLALGCAPMVNIFPQHCEPIRLDQTDTEYRVVPDARRAMGMEIWGITGVRETDRAGNVRQWQPFYRAGQGGSRAEAPGGYYIEARRPAAAALGGTETFLAPFAPEFDVNAPADTVLSVDALCVNRDLPAALPFGGGHPLLTLISPHDGVARIACLTPPGATLRPRLAERGAWRLISHLSLGHLSVVGGAEGAAALRDVLRLYDRAETAESRTAIEALVGVSAKPGTARVPGGRLGSFCRGLDVALEFDPKPYQDNGLFLLGAVLERFLALHGTVNSFVRTTLRLRGRVDPAMRFPPRAGHRTLL